MRKNLSFFFPVILLFVFFGFNPSRQKAQENEFRGMEILREFSRPATADPRTRSAQIKNIQVLGENSGVAFTDDALLGTEDNGATWREINLPREPRETISSISFDDIFYGWVILADRENGRLTLAKTEDGGINWTKIPVNVKTEHLQEADLSNTELVLDGVWYRTVYLKINLASSSNFVRKIFYKTTDFGQSWNPADEITQKREFDLESVAKINGENVVGQTGFNSNKWFLTADGKCEGFKSGCWQETKIYTSDKEITPPQIKEFSRIEKTRAKLQAENSVFAQPPGGTTRISLNRGFDKCTAATAAQMQTWWNNSPFYDVNIYLSGRNRGCTQAQLTAAWVNTVTAQGWGLIPTVVGYQSPCTASTTTAKFSSDPAVAEQQGRGEADIAIADANNLGLTQGTVLYYDMERYDDTSGTGACSTPTKAFLKGWTDRLHELGYKSGVYGSPFNANGDWINIAPASQPDIVWLARWNNVMSVWGVAPLPDNFWTNHQRIHQWLGPRDETWGGVTFNIDNDISDAPVAGLAIARNKRADFDGDGRTDISVWRPDTGVWYVWNSSNAGYSILNFGLSTDILAPGDYDGDGKTDFAVWRPETGVWHLYSRSIYRSFAFGTTGDIPVPADYDGDGRTDAAVFRPSTGVWYIWNSSDSRGTSYTILQFGLSGDKPVAGDYDGDGRDDIAVWRPSDSVWYLLQSTNGFAAAQFGISTDRPVQADYDGDGKTDLAVYRDGTWYLSQSQAGIRIAQFGLADDKPAVGDFDGDSRADITVFRPSTGVWYVWQSQAGIFSTQFGVANDHPVPAAYMP
jgi:hypothetical protein